MSGTSQPDENGEVRCEVPDRINAATMSKLWSQLEAAVEAQLGHPGQFVRIDDPDPDDGTVDMVFR